MNNEKNILKMKKITNCQLGSYFDKIIEIIISISQNLIDS